MSKGQDVFGNILGFGCATLIYGSMLYAILATLPYSLIFILLLFSVYPITWITERIFKLILWLFPSLKKDNANDFRSSRSYYSGSKHISQSYKKNQSSSVKLKSSNPSAKTTLSEIRPKKTIEKRFENYPAKKVNKPIPKPQIKLSEIQKRREITEKTAMKLVIEFEIRMDRKPKDVSKQNLGYDIISTDKNGHCRYIEVKGVGGTGNVIVTTNEYRTSKKQASHYYLYIIDNCLNNSPKNLYIVDDLGFRDLPQEEVSYSISQQEIQAVGTVC